MGEILTESNSTFIHSLNDAWSWTELRIICIEATDLQMHMNLKIAAGRTVKEACPPFSQSPATDHCKASWSMAYTEFPSCCNLEQIESYTWKFLKWIVLGCSKSSDILLLFSEPLAQTWNHSSKWCNLLYLSMQGTEKGLALFNSAQNESTMLQQAKPLLWTTQNMIRSATCAKLGGGSRHHSLRIVNERATDEKRLKSDKMKTAMPSPFRHRRLVSGPMLFPHSFRFHCKCCSKGFPNFDAIYCKLLWKAIKVVAHIQFRSKLRNDD